jgi:hypothetical protein
LGRICINSLGLECCPQFENSIKGYWDWKDWTENNSEGQNWWSEKWKEIDKQLKDYSVEDLNMKRA